MCEHTRVRFRAMLSINPAAATLPQSFGQCPIKEQRAAKAEQEAAKAARLERGDALLEAGGGGQARAG